MLALPGQGMVRYGTDSQVLPAALWWAAGSTILEQLPGAPKGCAGDEGLIPARGSQGALGTTGLGTRSSLLLRHLVPGKGPMLLRASALQWGEFVAPPSRCAGYVG